MTNPSTGNIRDNGPYRHEFITCLASHKPGQKTKLGYNYGLVDGDREKSILRAGNIDNDLVFSLLIIRATMNRALVCTLYNNSTHSPWGFVRLYSIKSKVKFTVYTEKDKKDLYWTLRSHAG